MVHHPISACRRVSRRQFLRPLLLCGIVVRSCVAVRAVFFMRDELLDTDAVQIPNLAQIYLIGFHEEREFKLYVSSISNELRIPVRFVSCPASCLLPVGWLVRDWRFESSAIESVLSILGT